MTRKAASWRIAVVVLVAFLITAWLLGSVLALHGTNRWIL